MNWPPMPKDTSVEIRQYGEKQVFVFNDHATALKPWAQISAVAGHPLYLLTLDYHTDTRPAFTNQAYWAQSDALSADALRELWTSQIDLTDSDSIEIAVQRLKHDEHIAAAVESGILAAALVVSINGDSPTHSVEHLATRLHSPQVLPPRPHHYDLHSPLVFRLNSQRELLENPERAIGSHFLRKTLEEADDMMAAMGQGPFLQSDYILDIDLDYFTCPASLNPRQSGRFYQLLNNGRAITVAREPGCVRMCSYQTMSADNSLELLDHHLVQALGARI